MGSGVSEQPWAHRTQEDLQQRRLQSGARRAAVRSAAMKRMARQPRRRAIRYPHLSRHRRGWMPATRPPIRVASAGSPVVASVSPSLQVRERAASLRVEGRPVIDNPFYRNPPTRARAQTRVSDPNLLHPYWETREVLEAREKYRRARERARREAQVTGRRLRPNSTCD